MPAVWFNSVTEGRANLRNLLDAAAHGFPAGLRRDRDGFAVLDAKRLRALLATQARRPEVIAEADGWSVLIPDTPVAADGATLAEAVAEMVDALREYAADWIDHLSTASNHADNWWLVQLTALSDDRELADWLTAGQLASQS
ncbi:prevent-host-death protein [Mycobacterium sp. M1]|uniref:Prevent-host-death protein n=1 Tax=Mycolicibacter acidiphilus TaxID=2835306 RepID=A0ABS5RIW5_9MYCO|nr:prevent-host-death protein [Mycolicibacter acidiphilus]MBS9534232.1 prevent-host-death protein [Mycolicibacter acidiphilus]